MSHQHLVPSIYIGRFFLLKNPFRFREKTPPADGHVGQLHQPIAGGGGDLRWPASQLREAAVTLNELMVPAFLPRRWRPRDFFEFNSGGIRFFFKEKTSTWMISGWLQFI